MAVRASSVGDVTMVNARAQPVSATDSRFESLDLPNPVLKKTPLPEPLDAPSGGGSPARPTVEPGSEPEPKPSPRDRDRMERSRPQQPFERSSRVSGPDVQAQVTSGDVSEDAASGVDTTAVSLTDPPVLAALAGLALLTFGS